MEDIQQIVDYLRKPELSFEVVARGGVLGTVRTMRSNLRSLLQAGSEPIADNITAESLDEHLDLARDSLEDLTDKLTSLNPAQTLELTRFSTRLDLYGGRLSTLMTVLNNLNLTATDRNVECNQMLDKFQSLKRTFQTLFMNHSSQTMVSTQLSVSDQPSVATISTIPLIDLPNPEGNLQGKGSESAPIILGQAHSTPEMIYGKLSHPAEKLISTLPITDGFDLEKLIKFIKIALSLRRIYPDIRRNILSVLMPYAKGPLSSCLAKHSTFRDFHREALTSFIPAKRRNILEQDLFFRPQGLKETLHHFVSDIKETAEVLLINKTEAEITQVIVEALSPEVRNCLVFANRPVNFNDLDALCAQVNNTLYVDNERLSTQGTFSRPEPDCRPIRSPIFCYKCGQKGHTSPQCRQHPSHFRGHNHQQYSKNVTRGGN